LIEERMIYILDYDVDIAFVVSEWLQLNGFEAKSFTALEQLFQNLTIQHPDCILLDCKYGKQDLLPHICNTIRNEFKYTGRIVITSATAILDKDLQLCNADGFMAKPFDFGGMIDVLNELVGCLDQRCAA
jgi:DNA-binding response OmpR family regulator